MPKSASIMSKKPNRAVQMKEENLGVYLSMHYHAACTTRRQSAIRPYNLASPISAPVCMKTSD